MPALACLREEAVEILSLVAEECPSMRGNRRALLARAVEVFPERREDLVSTVQALEADFGRYSIRKTRAIVSWV